MKYKVLIVDDEPIIAEGLSKVVDWDSLQCQVVATACDGTEGAELLKRLQPDILLTDINMPGVNGLEMLSQVREAYPQLQVTIISGYSDFSYAQEAIRLGAVRYLLKPTKMDEIYEAITAMKANLASNSAQEPENTNDSDTDTGEEEDGDANGFIIRQALAFIREHYAEKLTLSQVADHCYVSQWHLSKLLNGQVKQNFYEILNQIRIEKAKELLKNASLRISDVSEMVGYGEAAHFSRVFKKEVGISANEFRSTLK